MARFPSLSGSAQALRESVFARLARRLADYRGEIFPFYLGDTHLLPPDAARIAALVEDAAHYRYGAPAGEAELLDALVEKCRRRNGLGWVERAALQVTAGATHALHAAVRALLDPGDELLVCAPHWPLIRGIATNAGAVPVEAEVTQRLYADPAYDVYAALAARAGERTRAIYFATPNNPDGKVLPPPALEAIARLARERELWVIADEVYEDLVYQGAHHSIAALDGMAARTVTAFSLSKAYALAGYRLGYVVADPKVMHAIRKVANHSVYNVPAVLQGAGLAALRDGDPWITAARDAYRAARDAASRALAGVPHFLPDGGAYLFLDLRRWIQGSDDESVMRFHDRLLDGGVAVSPGVQFGSAYAAHARLCFTALPPEQTAKGLARLADLLR